MLFTPMAYTNYRMLMDAYRSQIERYSSTSEIDNAKVASAATMMTLSFFLDILIICMAIFFMFKCGAFKRWPKWVVILVVLMLFIPVSGGILALGIIGYGFASCQMLKR